MSVRIVRWLAPMWREACETQRQHLLSDEGDRFDRETTAVLLVTAFGLTAAYYLLIRRMGFGRWLVVTGENAELARQAYWAFGHVFIYAVVPALVIRLYLRRPLADYGLKLRGAVAYWWMYAAMYALMLPVILVVSQRSDFQRTYPFYDLAPDESMWPRLYLWELMYAMQFVALEFFFRGFLVHGTKRRFGPYCVLVMTVPYTMIHFGKPFPETLGAIIAGIALGVMSLKTRSIWMGAALHVAVAWTMDLAALWRR